MSAKSFRQANGIIWQKNVSLYLATACTTLSTDITPIFSLYLSLPFPFLSLSSLSYLLPPLSVIPSLFLLTPTGVLLSSHVRYILWHPRRKVLSRPASRRGGDDDGDRRRCKEDMDTRRKSNHNFAAQSHRCGKGRRGGSGKTKGGGGVFATVRADHSAGHSNTEFPVWHFTEPFEQDGAW